MGQAQQRSRLGRISVAPVHLERGRILGLCGESQGEWSTSLERLETGQLHIQNFQGNLHRRNVAVGRTVGGAVGVCRKNGEIAAPAAARTDCLVDDPGGTKARRPAVHMFQGGASKKAGIPRRLPVRSQNQKIKIRTICGGIQGVGSGC